MVQNFTQCVLVTVFLGALSVSVSEAVSEYVYCIFLWLLWYVLYLFLLYSILNGHAKTMKQGQGNNKIYKSLSNRSPLQKGGKSTCTLSTGGFKCFSLFFYWLLWKKSLYVPVNNKSAKNNQVLLDKQHVSGDCVCRYNLPSQPAT